MQKGSDIQRQSPSQSAIWLQAIRPRTLPLGVAGIMMGNILASQSGSINWAITVLTLLTALLLQIVANLANDYGDGVKRVDSTDRQGPQRLTANGVVTPAAMRLAVLITSLLVILSGLALLWVTWLTHSEINWGFWIGLGAFCLFAAIAYTVGGRPYGYRGMGDIAVFVFFGYVAVLGSTMLQTNTLSTLYELSVLLAATAIGLWSVAVLNINNMRDIQSDAQHGKMTIAVRLGLRNAIRFQKSLVTLAGVLWLIMVLLILQGVLLGLSILFSGIVLRRHLRLDWIQANGRKFTQELQYLSRDVLLQVLVFALFFIVQKTFLL